MATVTVYSPAVIPIKCTVMITAPQIMSVSSANPANVYFN